MRKRTPNSTPRWPFWLLIAAWVCANSPQAATYAVLTWIAEARQFSHQQQLTRDVAHLLVGEKAPARPEAIVAVATEDDRKASCPMVPATAVLKKIDLSTEKRIDGIRPSERIATLVLASDRWGDALRAPPPHGPPRVRVVI